MNIQAFVNAHETRWISLHELASELAAMLDADLTVARSALRYKGFLEAVDNGAITMCCGDTYTGHLFAAPGDWRTTVSLVLEGLEGERDIAIDERYLRGDYEFEFDKSEVLAWMVAVGIDPPAALREWYATNAKFLVELGETPPAPGVPERPPHRTPWLEIVEAAVHQFYARPRQVDPKRDEVVAWICGEAKKHGLAGSENIARAIFTIIKPPDHDPKRRRDGSQGLNPKGP